jgi:hypothetical protein
MAKKHKKGKKKTSDSSPINFGKGFAKIGQTGGRVGVIIAWIFLVLCIIGSCVMLYFSIKGGKTTAGFCDFRDNSPGSYCNSNWEEAECNSHEECQYNSTTSQMSSGTRIGLGVGAIFVVLLGIGILFLSKYVSNSMQKDKNLAAVGGGFLMADLIFGGHQ